MPIGHVITIADPAYDTHLAHGDPEVWTIKLLPDGSEVCTAGVEDTEKIVFITSPSFGGNLGGLDGADAKCQAEASAAGLEGTYKAWLSTADVSAASRLTHSTVPYVLVDGTQVTDNWADLTDGDIDAPITIDALGNAQVEVIPGIPTFPLYVWTGTYYWGSSYSDDCNGWTSSHYQFWGVVGWVSPNITNLQWSNATSQWCGNIPGRLYCFEQ